jgi:uncharacterized protein YlxW (UPF0749 family)
VTAVPDRLPAADARPRGLLLALTLAVLAAVLTLAARSTPMAAEARLGRRVELVELIAAEEARVRALEARVEELTADVAAYSDEGSQGQDSLAALQARIDELAAPAGLTGVEGPGVVATLADSALENAPTGNLNDLVIHEQDLQAVINALWAGGAEAVSVNGQRVLATTAIRCVGNTLLLHGGVYSPPYVVEAIGDEVALRDALGRDAVVTRFRDAVQRYALGFTVEAVDDLALPPYSGRAALQVARPVGSVEH